MCRNDLEFGDKLNALNTFNLQITWPQTLLGIRQVIADGPIEIAPDTPSLSVVTLGALIPPGPAHEHIFEGGPGERSAHLHHE